jgi:hypothetical protein
MMRRRWRSGRKESRSDEEIEGNEATIRKGREGSLDQGWKCVCGVCVSGVLRRVFVVGESRVEDK